MWDRNPAFTHLAEQKEGTLDWAQKLLVQYPRFIPHLFTLAWPHPTLPLPLHRQGRATPGPQLSLRQCLT